MHVLITKKQKETELKIVFPTYMCDNTKIILAELEFLPEMIRWCFFLSLNFAVLNIIKQSLVCCLYLSS